MYIVSGKSVIWITAGLLCLLAFNVHSAPVTSPSALETTKVTTSGTPVIAVTGGTAFNGCYIQNDPAATTNLVVDPVNIANHTTPASTAAFLRPGDTWNCPYNSVINITVDSYDSNHLFYGFKY
jgi:hypothetical protein